MATCKDCLHYEACYAFSKIINAARDVENGCEHFRNRTEVVRVVHARWEDVRETVMYVSDAKATFTHTAETCSACRARVGFVGPKMYLYDKHCPECGAMMDLGE